MVAACEQSQGEYPFARSSAAPAQQLDVTRRVRQHTTLKRCVAGLLPHSYVLHFLHFSPSARRPSTSSRQQSSPVSSRRDTLPPLARTGRTRPVARPPPRSLHAPQLLRPSPSQPESPPHSRHTGTDTDTASIGAFNHPHPHTPTPCLGLRTKNTPMSPKPHSNRPAVMSKHNAIAATNHSIKRIPITCTFSKHKGEPKSELPLCHIHRGLDSAHWQRCVDHQYLGLPSCTDPHLSQTISSLCLTTFRCLGDTVPPSNGFKTYPTRLMCISSLVPNALLPDSASRVNSNSNKIRAG
jgi:hypothetical protein